MLHLLVVGALSSERLRKVSADRLTVGARLERGAKGRLGLSTVLVANLDRLVSICDTSVSGALQVTRNHLGQVADNLGQVGSIIDLVLNVRKRRSVCRLQITDDSFEQ